MGRALGYLTHGVPLRRGALALPVRDGLQLWLDASRGGYQDSAKTTPAAAAGDPLGALADYSGNGRDATQSTASKRPTLQQVTNGGRTFNVARFDGVDDWWAANSLASLFSGDDQPFSLLAAVQVSSLAAQRTVFSLGSSSSDNPYHICYTETTPVWRDFRRDDAGAGTGPFSTISIDTNWHILGNVYSGSQSVSYKDGTAGTTGTVSAGVLTLNRATIGALGRTSEASFLVGDLAELVVYNRALSAAERQAVERYFAGRYGVTL